jgi:hypothetical protein
MARGKTANSGQGIKYRREKTLGWKVLAIDGAFLSKVFQAALLEIKPRQLEPNHQ